MPIRSDVDQILLSKFTSTTSDSRISDQLLMSKGTGSLEQMRASCPQNPTVRKSFGEEITRSTKLSLQNVLENCHLSKNLSNDLV